MYHIRGVLPKWGLPPLKEISCHIFKMAIFSKFFDDLMSHIKSQLNSEWIYEDIVSPKMPGSLLKVG